MTHSLPFRLGASAVLVGLASSLAPMATLAAFGDVKASTSYATAIGALQQKGVLQGYANGTFKPEQPITRGEFLKIILEARGDVREGGADCFSDVKDEWFAKYVCAAKAEGIVSGYADGTAKPGQNINFVEASKILSLAYKQKTQGDGVEWYEPYTNALESAKAIPPSIAKLDAPLMRGEMAEMMWRISEKKTDQPTKGVLNIKHPEMAINAAADTIQTAKTCADLGAMAQESGSRMRNQDMNYRTKSMRTNDAFGGVAAPMAGNANAEAQTGGGGDYSQTNVQVEGVDEGDSVKTDGTYLYTIQNGKVYIVRAHPASQMAEAATLDFSKENVSPTELYVDGNRLIVLGNSWGRPGPLATQKRMSPAVGDMMIRPYYLPQRQEVRIYNVTDATKPVLERTLRFDGNTISTRMIASKLYLVLNQPMQWDYPRPLAELKDAEILPSFSDSKKGDADMPVARCGTVSILPHVPSPAYMTVAVVPTNDLTTDVKTKTIVGDGQNVYASAQNLYVASTQYDYVWDSARPQSNEKTNLFRFAFGADGIDLKAQGSVPGHLLNQFAMDEHENTFRVATTVGQAWDSAKASSNNLYVTNMDLQTVGKIEDIAPGEQIYSVRFLGNRAYMVTFKTVDPLFVIDTSDARNPKILGKLKIPGYSNYLHPYDENHVIGFGKEVDESIDADKVHTDNAVYYTAIQGMKVSIFDVTDVSNPKEMYKEVIGDRGTESPLLYDHHALLFDKSRNLLAFPVSVMTVKDKSVKPDQQMSTQTFQGAYVYDISLDKGLQLRGKISHYTDADWQKAGDSLWGKDVSRIVRIDNSLLSLSQAAVQSHTLSDVKYENKVDFPVDASSRPGPIMY